LCVFQQAASPNTTALKLESVMPAAHDGHKLRQSNFEAQIAPAITRPWVRRGIWCRMDDQVMPISADATGLANKSSCPQQATHLRHAPRRPTPSRRLTSVSGLLVQAVFGRSRSLPLTDVSLGRQSILHTEFGKPGADQLDV
jgi:hypothetical protein